MYSLKYALCRIVFRMNATDHKFNIYGSVHHKYILIYIYTQQDAILHSLFIPGNCSICFRWYLHSSSEAHTTVFTFTLTASCHYRGGAETPP
jgi:hypothetical protein